MIINPKNKLVFSSVEQSYVSYLQDKMSLLKSSNYDYKVLVDTVYTLGQVRQEIFDDEDINPDCFCYLVSLVDDYFSSIRKCEVKMWGDSHE